MNNDLGETANRTTSEEFDSDLSRREIEVGDEVEIDVAPATTLDTVFEHVARVVELLKTSDGDPQAIVRIVRSLEEDRDPDAARSCYNGCKFVTRPWSAKGHSRLEAQGPADEATRRAIEEADEVVAYMDYLEDMDRLRESGYTDPFGTCCAGLA